MGRLRGIAVVLYTKNKVGEDEFGAPVYEELPEVVNDVLVGEPEGSDVTDTLNLTGKRLAYTLAIPKGDTHEWRDRKVEFFGRKYGDVQYRLYRLSCGANGLFASFCY